MPEITLTTDDLPQIEEWEEGERYRIVLNAVQTTPTADGQAKFEIDLATGREALPSEELEQSELSRRRGDTQAGPSFDEAASEAAQETLEPSTATGNESVASRDRIS